MSISTSRKILNWFWVSISKIFYYPFLHLEWCRKKWTRTWLRPCEQTWTSGRKPPTRPPTAPRRAPTRLPIRPRMRTAKRSPTEPPMRTTTRSPTRPPMRPPIWRRSLSWTGPEAIYKWLGSEFQNPNRLPIMRTYVETGARITKKVAPPPI